MSLVKQGRSVFAGETRSRRRSWKPFNDFVKENRQRHRGLHRGILASQARRGEEERKGSRGADDKAAKRAKERLKELRQASGAGAEPAAAARPQNRGRGREEAKADGCRTRAAARLRRPARSGPSDKTKRARSSEGPRRPPYPLESRRGAAKPREDDDRPWAALPPDPLCGAGPSTGIPRL